MRAKGWEERPAGLDEIGDGADVARGVAINAQGMQRGGCGRCVGRWDSGGGKPQRRIGVGGARDIPGGVHRGGG